MSRRRKHIDEFFRENLGEYEKNPPFEIWEHIQSELNSETKRKAIPLFWRIAAGIAILLGFSLSFYLLLREPPANVYQAEDTSVQPLIKNLPDDRMKEEISSENFFEGKSKEVENIDYPAMKNEGIAAVKTDQNAEKEKLTTNKEQVITASEKTARVNQTPGSLSVDYNADLVKQEKPVQIVPFSKPDNILALEQNVETVSWEMLQPAEELVIEKQRNRLLLSAIMSPIYSYRNVSTKSIAPVEILNNSENGVISYSGGFQLGIEAGKRLSFYTGLVYSRMGIGIKDIMAYAGNKNEPIYDRFTDGPLQDLFMISNSIGIISTNKGDAEFLSTSDKEVSSNPNFFLRPNGLYGSTSSFSIEDVAINQYFHFLEVPLMFKYKMIDRKIDLNVIGGLSANLLVDNDVYAEIEGDRQYLGYTNDLQTFNYSGNIGIGMNYDLGSHFIFHFEPQLKYHLNSINDNQLILSRPYSLGLYSGVSYKF